MQKIQYLNLVKKNL